MGNSLGLSNMKGKKYHFTYQTKCMLNEKTYIGRHSTNNLEDGYLGSGKLLRRAIKKYGKENFRIIPLCFFKTYKDVVEEEKFLVTKEWCNKKSNYNLVEGAENPRMYGEMNPSWKGGVSKDPNYRITGPYDYSGKNNPRYGYKYSKKEKLDMIKSQPNNNVFKVNGVLYLSINDYKKKNKKSYDYVSRRLFSDDFPEWVLVGRRGEGNRKKK